MTIETNIEWNAGDMGCGELVFELKVRMQELKPGDIIRVTALDAGAREDLPAWCRLTGHLLSKAEHPHYWIKKKEN